MIEFKIGKTADTIIDMELSRFGSLTDFSREFEHEIDQRKENDSLNISLIPPISPNISIPTAFKVVMGHLGQIREKNIRLFCHIESKEIIDYLVKYLPPELAAKSTFFFGDIEVCIQVADIVAVKTEAIVNASNQELKLGGGVSGAIRNAAHPDAQVILDGIASSKKLEPGDAVLTDGLGINGVRQIIHVASVKGTIEVVRESIMNVIELCEQNSIECIAIPALGTGTGGLSLKECAKIFNKVIKERNAACATLRKIVIALWRKTDYDTFVTEFMENEHSQENS